MENNRNIERRCGLMIVFSSYLHLAVIMIMVSIPFLFTASFIKEIRRAFKNRIDTENLGFEVNFANADESENFFNGNWRKFY